MEPAFSNSAARAARPFARLARAGAGPLLALVLAGLLADPVNHAEAYAGIDYGLSLLALLGATGSIVCLMGWLSAGPLSGTGLPALVTRPSAALAEGSAAGEDWPLVVALLFGALVVLISGLGGWV